MPPFELERLTSYDDSSLISEIRRVAALVPNALLKCEEFNRLSKVHSSTLFLRFGSWRKTLAAAGLEHRFDEGTEAWTREEIIERLQSIARASGRSTVKQRELREQSGITPRPILRLFGSYRAALIAAGLSQSPGGIRYSDEECFENLLTVWTALGRQPHYSEMKLPPSQVGPKAYIGRWGSWRKALQGFVERANQDFPPETRPEAQPGTKIPDSVQPKRTSRSIPLGLRYRVLSRDRFHCVICGRVPKTHQIVIHVDHINPWSKGGETVIENLRTLCSDCNLGKSARIEDV